MYARPNSKRVELPEDLLSVANTEIIDAPLDIDRLYYADTVLTRAPLPTGQSTTAGIRMGMSPEQSNDRTPGEGGASSIVEERPSNTHYSGVRRVET